MWFKGKKIQEPNIHATLRSMSKHNLTTAKLVFEVSKLAILLEKECESRKNKIMTTGEK